MPVFSVYLLENAVMALSAFSMAISRSSSVMLVSFDSKHFELRSNFCGTLLDDVTEIMRDDGENAMVFNANTNGATRRITDCMETIWTLITFGR